MRSQATYDAEHKDPALYGRCSSLRVQSTGMFLQLSAIRFELDDSRFERWLWYKNSKTAKAGSCSYTTAIF